MEDKDGGGRRAKLRLFCTLVALVSLLFSLREGQQKQNTTVHRSRLLSNIFSNHDTTTRSWTTPTGVEIQTRIVGGKDVTDPNLYPSYGFNKGDGLCGGTLIHPDIVLTAAHCSTIFQDGWMQGGVTVNGAGSTFVAVAESVPHPDYQPGPEHNDIMLVKLANPINATLQKLNFDPSVPPDGTTVTVIGFGNTAENGQGSSMLQEVQSTIVSFAICNGFYEDIINDKQICMDGSKGKDSCQGDSGGPLLLNDGTQIGLVSFGVGCARTDVPASVFTRISGYKQWINENVCKLSSQPPASCVGTSTPTKAPVVSPTETAPSPVNTPPTSTPTSGNRNNPTPNTPTAQISAPVPTLPSGKMESKRFKQMQRNPQNDQFTTAPAPTAKSPTLPPVKFTKSTKGMGIRKASKKGDSTNKSTKGMI